MGLFGGVSQTEFDNLSNDFKRLKFNLSLEEFKAAHAILFSDMKHHVGVSCGIIDTVGALVEAKLFDTAKTAFILTRGKLAEHINKANESHRAILDSVNSIGDLQAVYINHLSTTCGDASPLHEQVNGLNELQGQCVNMFNSFDQMFEI
ncbi:hypothetical protein LFD09_004341 [Salmonella enterica]|nr:hypothetical protein [Salmonella enterica]